MQRKPPTLHKMPKQFWASSCQIAPKSSIVWYGINHLFIATSYRAARPCAPLGSAMPPATPIGGSNVRKTIEELATPQNLFLLPNGNSIAPNGHAVRSDFSKSRNKDCLFIVSTLQNKNKTSLREGVQLGNQLIPREARMR